MDSPYVSSIGTYTNFVVSENEVYDDLIDSEGHRDNFNNSKSWSRMLPIVELKLA